MHTSSVGTRWMPTRTQKYGSVTHDAGVSDTRTDTQDGGEREGGVRV